MSKTECILHMAITIIESNLTGRDYWHERTKDSLKRATEALRGIHSDTDYLCHCGFGCHDDSYFSLENGQLVQHVGL